MKPTLQSGKDNDARAGRELRFGKESVTITLTGEETNGVMAVYEIVREKGNGVPLHTHVREDEMFHILEGAFEIRLGDETRTVSAGEAIFLPRGVPHSFKVVSDQPGRMLAVATPAGMEHYFAEMFPYVGRDVPDYAAMSAIAHRYEIEFALPTA